MEVEKYNLKLTASLPLAIKVVPSCLLPYVDLSTKSFVKKLQHVHT